LLRLQQQTLGGCFLPHPVQGWDMRPRSQNK